MKPWWARGPSKRRWKARCRLGKPIPRDAIENWSLTRWFGFDYDPGRFPYTEYYVAKPKRVK